MSCKLKHKSQVQELARRLPDPDMEIKTICSKVKLEKQH